MLYYGWSELVGLADRAELRVDELIGGGCFFADAGCPAQSGALQLLERTVQQKRSEASASVISGCDR